MIFREGKWHQYNPYRKNEDKINKKKVRKKKRKKKRKSKTKKFKRNQEKYLKRKIHFPKRSALSRPKMQEISGTAEDVCLL